MKTWVLNKTETDAWRACNVPLPPEMVEHVAFYLYDPIYEYDHADNTFCMAIAYMCGNSTLRQNLERLFNSGLYSPLDWADIALNTYLTHPNDIIANNHDELYRWFNMRMDWYLLNRKHSS